MKKGIKNIRKGILMVAMMAASLSFANEGAPFYRVANDAKKTALTLAYVKEGSVLSIKDYYGEVLYKESIKQNGLYAKGFDLTALPSGSYFFELDSDVAFKVIPFTIKSNTIVYNRDEAKTIYKPITRVKGDLVFVSKLNLSKEPLKVNIYYQKGDSSDLIMEETISDSEKVERVYKLTGLKSGDYKIVMSTEGKTFTEYINN
ncbi:hypothetical protein KO566_01585 [Flavobacteriaceae bacterium XHP0103]|uniref:hypothetical protein n=1 Tax=Marixanthotalea marina TaxID=2844359 RepID=UPI002989B716|nr:hypothetical protein [Marixanthotalea marina]MBU3820738.1 hypothetical protein [Marixanthotalea marina]